MLTQFLKINKKRTLGLNSEDTLTNTLTRQVRQGMIMGDMMNF